MSNNIKRIQSLHSTIFWGNSSDQKPKNLQNSMISSFVANIAGKKCTAISSWMQSVKPLLTLPICTTISMASTHWPKKKKWKSSRRRTQILCPLRTRSQLKRSSNKPSIQSQSKKSSRQSNKPRDTKHAVPLASVQCTSSTSQHITWASSTRSQTSTTSCSPSHKGSCREATSTNSSQYSSPKRKEVLDQFVSQSNSSQFSTKF